MPPRIYIGPCPDHPGPTVYRKHCKHCLALLEQKRRDVQQFNVPIFRELHWPAPHLSEPS